MGEGQRAERIARDNARHERLINARKRAPRAIRPRDHGRVFPNRVKLIVRVPSVIFLAKCNLYNATTIDLAIIE